MAKLKPFKALRPVRDKVHLVATRPYYQYKKNVLRAKLQSNPYTFLRIINPEFDLPKKERVNTTLVETFGLVKKRYEEFIEKKILFRDKEPHIYLYRQTQNGHAYTGIVAGASVDEYQRDLIKRHEATITSREEMFISYLDVVGYNAEPVLLSHEPAPDLDRLFNLVTQERPEYEFTTTDTIKHELWCIPQEIGKQIQDVFEDIPCTYIADGHHRSASSSGLHMNRMQQGIQFDNQGFFLSFFIDETKLKVYEYNRLVKNITTLSKEEILKKLSRNFEVEKMTEARRPAKEHEITMYFEKDWYRLTCHEDLINEQDPVGCLDAEILTQYALSPVFQIHDLKTDQNIGFVSGVQPLEKMCKKVEKEKYDILFCLYPVRMDQVKRVADHKMIMPPKSTWVEPKMRSGLTIYNINE